MGYLILKKLMRETPMRAGPPQARGLIASKLRPTGLRPAPGFLKALQKLALDLDGIHIHTRKYYMIS